MGILHHYDRGGGFVLVPKSIFDDARLGIMDIGVLCYIMSRPDDDINADYLLDIFPGEKYSSLERSLNKLELAGYLGGLTWMD